MKLELKKIKYCKWMSEETHCYNAVVYVDGKAMISVSNEGHGGSNSEWAIKPFTQQDVDRVNAWCKKNLPKWKIDNGDSYHTDLEIWCGEEMSKYIGILLWKIEIRSNFLQWSDFYQKYLIFS